MLELAAERITLRELIAARVRAEVEAFNHAPDTVFHGLVQPAEAEAAVNGFRLRRKRQIDWGPQLEKALAGFESGRILVLAGDRQIESLDENLDVTGPSARGTTRARSSCRSRATARCP